MLEPASPYALWETPTLPTLGAGVCVRGRRWFPYQLPIGLLQSEVSLATKTPFSCLTCMNDLMEKSGIDCSFGTRQGKTNSAGEIQGDFRGLRGLAMNQTLLRKHQDDHCTLRVVTWRSYILSPEQILVGPRVGVGGRGQGCLEDRWELGEMRGHQPPVVCKALSTTRNLYFYLSVEGRALLKHYRLVSFRKATLHMTFGQQN